jgi:hypothetical protein
LSAASAPGMTKEHTRNAVRNNIVLLKNLMKFKSLSSYSINIFAGIEVYGVIHHENGD